MNEIEEMEKKAYKCPYCKNIYDVPRDAEECMNSCIEKKFSEELNKKEFFEMKDEHLKLLNNMFVEWNNIEFGAPKIDPKRPYGNSDGVDDVARVLDYYKTQDKVDLDEGELITCRNESERQELIEDSDWKGEWISYFEKLHKETKIALQIVLVTGKFETGKYQKKERFDSQSWVKVEND